jgi:hypothetical protein
MKTLNNLFRRIRASRIKHGLRPQYHLDAREVVQRDFTTTTLHPTKGFRRVSGKRVIAQARIYEMLGR